MLKDHYRTLGLPPSATQAEIKKAYRRLARDLHPDKTQDDPYAKEKFHAVKEAYETLTNPQKKQDYLQQRWYYQAVGQKMNSTVLTPETMLQQSLELEKYIRSLDHYRMDREGLAKQMAEWLGDDRIRILNGFNDPKANDLIVASVLRCIEPLGEKQEQPLLASLRKLRVSPAGDAAILAFETSRKYAHSWDRHKTWLMLLLVLAICLMIFFFAQ
jgi:hypothetical protein